jgi:hypothetical protein
MEPPEEVRPEALVPLTSFKSTNWHLGDRAVLLPAGATTATITAELLQSLMAGHFGTLNTKALNPKAVISAGPHGRPLRYAKP